MLVFHRVRKPQKNNFLQKNVQIFSFVKLSGQLLRNVQRAMGRNVWREDGDENAKVYPSACFSSRHSKIAKKRRAVKRSGFFCCLFTLTNDGSPGTLLVFLNNVQYTSTMTLRFGCWNGFSLFLSRARVQKREMVVSTTRGGGDDG